MNISMKCINRICNDIVDAYPCNDTTRRTCTDLIKFANFYLDRYNCVWPGEIRDIIIRGVCRKFLRQI